MDAATTAAVTEIVKDGIVSPVVVATLLSTLLLGIVLSLSSCYFAKFGTSDRWKWLVLYLTAISIGDTINNTTWIYYTCVTHWGDLEKALLWRPQFTGYLWYTGITIAVVQGFFLYRLHIVSGGEAKLLVGAGILATLAGMASEFYCAVWVQEHATQLADFVQIAKICWVYVGFQLLSDVITTGGLVWYLYVRPRKQNAGLNMKQSGPLRKILNTTVTTNATSFALQLAVVILVGLSIRWGTLTYVIPGFLESKMYAASLLAALLARDSTRNTSYPSTGSALPHSRSKANDIRSPLASVHVHIEREVETDDPDAIHLHEAQKLPYEGADAVDLEEKAERRSY